MRFHKLWVERRYIGEFADFDDAKLIAKMLAGGESSYLIETYDENHKRVGTYSNRVPDELISSE